MAKQIGLTVVTACIATIASIDMPSAQVEFRDKPGNPLGAKARAQDDFDT